MHDNKRSYIYWDGAEMAALARHFADPSLNWIDPLLLAAAKLGRGDAQHVWYSTAHARTLREEQAQRLFHRFLASRGIDLRLIDSPPHEVECGHCGHGWSDDAAITSLALVLGLVRDATQNRIDCAYIISNAMTQALLIQHKAILPTRTDIVAVTLDAASLEAARLPRMVDGAKGSKLQRPAIWNKPKWLAAEYQTSFSESGV